jgi:hypothetical protein
MLAHSLHWFDWWRRAAALGWGQLDRLAALHDPRPSGGSPMRQLTPSIEIAPLPRIDEIQPRIADPIGDFQWPLQRISPATSSSRTSCSEGKRS